MVMAKKSQVKFRLFEKNGSIRIAIQTVSEQEEKNPKLNTSVEYYIASDPRNVSRILDTLVSTVKDVSISGDNLCTNYRKHDTFIIEDYERLKNYPELKPFFNKMGGKIKQQKAKNRENTSKPSSKRKKVRVGKKLLVAASFMVTFIVAGFIKSDMMAQESVSDTLVADNTDENSEDEIQEVLEKYQASIVETQFSRFEIVESEEIIDVEKSASVVEEIPEKADVEEMEEKSEEDSQTAEEFTDTIPEVPEEGNQDSQKEDKDEEKEDEDEKESTDEVTLAEIDEEVTKIAADLVAQNKTSEEDIKKAALALQDGQASVELAQIQTKSATQEVVQAQAITVTAIDTTTPVMNTDGSGINYVATYHLTPEQIDIIKATIQHEAGFNEVEVEKVTSVVINRCESGGWPGGTNPYGVIVGKGQFQSYYAGYYKKYLNGNYADYTDQIVNAMLTGEQAPSHPFERFASGENATGTQFTKGGNKYR